MSDELKKLDEFFERFDRSAQGHAIQLRMDLAELIWTGLSRKRWTQTKLAEACNLKDSAVSNLVHGSKNCTFSTAAKVMHALDMEIRLYEAVTGRSGDRELVEGQTGNEEIHYNKKGETGGKKAQIIFTCKQAC